MTAAEQAAAIGVSAGRGWELDSKDGGRLQFYSGQQQASGGTGEARISALPWARGLLSHVDLTLMLLYATPLQPRICLRRVVAFYAAISDVSFIGYTHIPALLDLGAREGRRALASSLSSFRLSSARS
jgi:hypothetical protein